MAAATAIEVMTSFFPALVAVAGLERSGIRVGVGNGVGIGSGVLVRLVSAPEMANVAFEASAKSNADEPPTTGVSVSRKGNPGMDQLESDPGTSLL
jgi:hypothetical protein